MPAHQLWQKNILMVISIASPRATSSGGRPVKIQLVAWPEQVRIRPKRQDAASSAPRH
jgi:hypothetical protein